MSPILLDTCAAIWLVEGEVLAQPASHALAVASDGGCDAFVSVITAWELGMLVSKGRLNLPLAPLAWFEGVLAKPQIALAEMTARIWVASSFLPGSPPADPMDRIIAATAREHGFRLMTRDRTLLRYAEQGHLLAIAC
jgi:PIN domain nuclease of toxin-antitoxin system